LIEDVTEYVDELVHLTSAGGRQRSAPSSLDSSDPDILSAFWLGIATASSADASLEKALARYAAENVAGFTVGNDSQSAGEPATTYR